MKVENQSENTPIRDLRKAINIFRNKSSLLDKVKQEFYSGERIKWLEDFSASTAFCYNDWYNACKLLLHNSVIPDLKVLNSLNRTAMAYSIDPWSLMSVLC